MSCTICIGQPNVVYISVYIITMCVLIDSLCYCILSFFPHRMKGLLNFQISLGNTTEMITYSTCCVLIVSYCKSVSKCYVWKFWQQLCTMYTHYYAMYTRTNYGGLPKTRLPEPCVATFIPPPPHSSYKVITTCSRNVATMVIIVFQLHDCQTM